MKKLPPYGKYLHDLQQNNQTKTLLNHSIYVFIGQRAWDKAKNFTKFRHTTMCLPPFVDPFMYFWPVQECDVLLFDTGNCDADYIREIAECLLDFNASVVRCCTNGKLTVFKKDF